MAKLDNWFADGWMDGWMIYEWKKERKMGGWMDDDGWKKERKKGRWMDGWIYRALHKKCFGQTYTNSRQMHLAMVNP